MLQFSPKGAQTIYIYKTHTYVLYKPQFFNYDHLFLFFIFPSMLLSFLYSFIAVVTWIKRYTTIKN